MVGFYFDKKRALATGIAVCGSGIGTFVLAPIINFFVSEYGWKVSVAHSLYIFIVKSYNVYLFHTILDFELDGQGKARREAARRRNSECKINLSCRNSSPGNGSRPTAQW